MTITGYYHNVADIVGRSPACRCPWEDRPCVSGCGTVWLADTSLSLVLYQCGWRRDLHARLSLLYEHMKEQFLSLSCFYEIYNYKDFIEFCKNVIGRADDHPLTPTVKLP